MFWMSNQTIIFSLRTLNYRPVSHDVAHFTICVLSDLFAGGGVVVCDVFFPKQQQKNQEFHQIFEQFVFRSRSTHSGSNLLTNVISRHPERKSLLVSKGLKI